MSTVHEQRVLNFNSLRVNFQIFYLIGYSSLADNFLIVNWKNSKLSNWEDPPASAVLQIPKFRKKFEIDRAILNLTSSFHGLLTLLITQDRFTECFLQTDAF